MSESRRNVRRTGGSSLRSRQTATRKNPKTRTSAKKSPRQSPTKKTPAKKTPETSQKKKTTEARPSPKPTQQPNPRLAPRTNRKSLEASVTLKNPPKRRKPSVSTESKGAKSASSPKESPSSTAGSRADELQASSGASPAVHSVYPTPTADGEGDPYPINALDVTMLGIGSRVFPPNLDIEIGEEITDDDDGGSLFADDPSVETRIREIEEHLDGLMATVPHEDLDRESPAAIDDVPAAADSAVDTAREVLESGYYRSKWGKGSIQRHADEVDEFGRDEAYEDKLRPLLEFLYKKYFRVEVEGIENVPASGRAVIVANHSGALPFDGVMLREAIRLQHPERNDLRWLAEDFSFYLPFLGVTLNRIGAVRACPENAERLLEREHLVGVFPEGAEGTKKLYKDRYQLQRFGRGGFIRLCLRTSSPIVPCAIVGAEETNPILYRFDNLSKLLGLDYLPITPTFPLLGPLGLLPAPTKWKLVFGEPISFEEYGPQAALDHVLVGRLAEKVRLKIGELLESTLRRRKSVWL